MHGGVDRNTKYILSKDSHVSIENIAAGFIILGMQYNLYSSVARSVTRKVLLVFSFSSLSRLVCEYV